MTRQPIKRGPRRKRPKARKPVKRKPTRKMTQRRQCDTLFSKLIRARDGACMACGGVEFLQCSHHVSRAYLPVRYDFGNAVAHCRRCHMAFTNDPLRHEEWIVGHIGREAFDDLKRRARALEQYRPDYSAILSELRERLKEAA